MEVQIQIGMFSKASSKDEADDDDDDDEEPHLTSTLQSEQRERDVIRQMLWAGWTCTALSAQHQTDPSPCSS